MQTFEYLYRDIRKSFFSMAMLPFIAIASIALLCGCGGGSGGGGGGGTYVNVNTLDGQTGIATDSNFQYTFSGVPDATTITATSYFIVPTPTTPAAQVAKAAFDATVCNVANAIAATVSAGTSYANLDPAQPLTGGTQYTVCLTTDIRVGGAAFAGFMATFTTLGGGAQTERLRITNSCEYTIWIQQQNMAAGTPSVVKLAPGAHQDYEIPDEGLASTRLWPKKGCDETGENCTIGQSSNPCPAGGCPPPIDSKIEATWGCTLADQTQCAITPQGDPIGDTYWNSSAVDGYTFPFTATVTGNTITDQNQPCQSADCSNLLLGSCPTSDNLSVGETGTVYPAYASVDLSVKNGDGTVIGCYSPCKKFNYPTFEGYNLNEDSDPPVIYCCPTPPISSEQCRAGPVVNTDYVTEVHRMCNSEVYTFAYDDALGLRHCSAGTLVEMTFGPNCP
jgi:hypothetical protein